SESVGQVMRLKYEAIDPSPCHRAPEMSTISATTRYPGGVALRPRRLPAVRTGRDRSGQAGSCALEGNSSRFPVWSLTRRCRILAPSPGGAGHSVRRRRLAGPRVGQGASIARVAWDLGLP